MIWFMHTGRFRVLAALRFFAASRFIQLPSIYDADLFRRRRLAVNAACGVAQYQQRILQFMRMFKRFVT